ncbi:MAG: hypothetical protein RLP14_01360 [Owenweeksia sp.]
MKKLFFSIMCTVSIASLNAQSNLPQAGDQSLQLNALPVINLVADMFNGTEGNALNYGTDFTYRKYLSPEKARTHRFKLGGRGYTNYYNNASFDTVYTRTLTYRSFNAEYYWGTEYRKSLNNIQGFIGYEIGGSISGSTINYDYNISLTSPDFDGQRPLEYHNYPEIGVGANFLIGAEYFFARNFSVGVIFRNGLRLNYDTGSESKDEFDNRFNEVVLKTTKNPGSFGYDLFSGSFGLNFSWIF